MPVPVPRHSKQPAHLVIKSHSDDGANHSFQDLTGTLPVSPTGPPPSFGTREQWINSLPSWRRSKPRRIWEDDCSSLLSTSAQDFPKGLAVAVNAPAIKGSRAEACAPPLSAISQPGFTAPDDEMQSLDTADNKAYSIATSMESVRYDEHDRGVFTPIFEEESPESRSLHEASSSPIEPVTPFGDFVDRAVSSTSYSAPFNAPLPCGVDAKLQGYRFIQPIDSPKVPAPAPDLVTPTATSGYRKLSEPLSEWIANFVWKACTTSTNVPAFIVRPRSTSSKIYSVTPPSYLATSVHSLLLSTLLQPSVVFLALWYIVRLPVFFDAANYPEHVKEYRFRVALLGESQLDRDAMENAAPFRLIVLGCMLANKWLDDHTFSNKTWHSISNVPIQTLNQLESLTLDIFAYDLSISAGDWSDWLSHVMSYHVSLLSPSHRQPISRPSTNPHLIIKIAIEEIVNAPRACHFDCLQPQPVFIGLEERRKEKQEKGQKAEVLEIDLDEDGPLREEYMPKRRVSGASPTCSTENISASQRPSWEVDVSTVENHLPPPAKWSPAGDEPIFRESNHPYGRYVAVQPTPGLNLPVTTYQVLPQYQPAHDLSYAAQAWLPNVPFATTTTTTAKPLPNAGHFFDFAPLQHPLAPPIYNHYPPLVLPFALSHSRSQSYFHDQDTSQSRNHTRSYSQSQFEYRCSDLCMTANELPPSMPQDTDMPWGHPGHYPYGAPAFAPHATVAYSSAWLRT
jgi:hypothetical protein